MKRFVLIALAVISLASCQPEKQDLLTSTTWKEEGKSSNGTDTYETLKFNKDNTFEKAYGVTGEADTKEIVVRGTWEQKSDTEVIAHGTEMVIGGQSNSIEGNAENFVIQITELSQTKLVGNVRHEGDAPESGFAKPIMLRPVDL